MHAEELAIRAQAMAERALSIAMEARAAASEAMPMIEQGAAAAEPFLLLLSSVFVPLFALLGYEPAFIQGAFRVGDSATQVITPLNPYMIVLLTMLRKYEPNAGLGTLMARMLPFVVPFWLAWVAILTVFFYLDLPMGPGNDIFIE